MRPNALQTSTAFEPPVNSRHSPGAVGCTPHAGAASCEPHATAHTPHPPSACRIRGMIPLITTNLPSNLAKQKGNHSTSHTLVCSLSHTHSKSHTHTLSNTHSPSEKTHTRTHTDPHARTHPTARHTCCWVAPAVPPGHPAHRPAPQCLTASWVTQPAAAETAGTHTYAVLTAHCCCCCCRCRPGCCRGRPGCCCSQHPITCYCCCLLPTHPP